MTCSNCGFLNDPDAQFCENCGIVLPRVCVQCGSPLKPAAKFCKQCGTPVATSEPARETTKRLAALRRSAPSSLQAKFQTASQQIEGERKPVTILFTDIVGSTSHAEKLDPEEWKEIVSGAHQRVSEAVYRYEGTIAQLLGDGVLAFFGAPITHEDDPIRAVRAGLDLQHSIEEYNQQLKGYIENFQLRVGINTGLVVVGNVGDDMHMEYLAIGDAVNLAARLQSAARPGKVLISEATEHLVKTAFELNPLDQLTVKGKAEPVKVFEVIDCKALALSGRGSEQLPSPFVGRAADLDTLKSALAELTAGHGQIVTVTGEAGIGKSRLAEEARTIGLPVKWLEGRALSYGQTLSFWTITQLIKNDLGLSDADPEPKIKAALRRRLAALSGAQADEAFPFLAQLLGIKPDGDAAQHLQSLDADKLKQQIYLSISNYFAWIATEQPTVLVFEDLHWADPSTLAVLESLFALTDRVPILLLLLARVERDQAWWQVKQRAETEYAHRYTEIALKPLSTPEQNQLVDGLLEIAQLPAAIRCLILERSEGNPFYLEEIIRSLIEQGALVHEGQHWRATREIANIQIPDTLQGIILARIDRLREDVRRTLQIAAVIGKSFLYRLLAEVIVDAGQQIEAHLSQLQRADLVREKTRLPDLEYVFKHSLTQEATYNSLLLERRKEFHGKVGAALESLFADRLEEAYGLLAHHFSLAGQSDKALEYSLKAGDRARELFAYQAAIDYYQQALGWLKDQKDYENAARTLMKLGLLYHTVFDFARSQQAYDEGFQLWQRASETAPAVPLPLAPHALRVPWGAVRTLDPALAYDTDSAEVICQLFSGLVELTPDLDVVPEVARTWEVVEDGRMYIFHLRDDVVWNDGTPLTAHDFEYAWKRALDPRTKAGAADHLYVVKGAAAYHQGRTSGSDEVGIRALDDRTLVVEMENPTSYFLHLLASLTVAFPVPRHVVEAQGAAWTTPGKIVSNGAFQLEAWRPNQLLTATRNPLYHGRFTGNVQRVELPDDAEMVRDQSKALRMYESDQLDINFFWQSELEEVIYRHAAEYVTAPYAGEACFIFNLTSAPFNDVRVRCAFVHAIDREKLAGAVLEGRVSPATGGFVPPGVPGHSPGLGLAYDPETAQRLLAEAGYPNGQGFPAIEMLTLRQLDRIRVTEYLQAQWQQILGVKVTRTLVDSPQQIEERIRTARPALYGSGWAADYPDAAGFLRSFTTARTPEWHNEDFNHLIETASRVSDQAERIRLYQAADRIFIEEAVVLPLVYLRLHILVKPWISKLALSPIKYWRWKDIVIEPH